MPLPPLDSPWLPFAMLAEMPAPPLAWVEMPVLFSTVPAQEIPQVKLLSLVVDP